MNRMKNHVVGNTVQLIKSAIAAFSILGVTLLSISCADLREEFDPSKWQYRPVPNMPPSWENDYGRPPMGYDGAEPFQ